MNQFGKKLFVHIGALISVIIVGFALWFMYRTLHSINLRDILRHLESQSIFSIGLGFLITAASYFTITGYDVTALRHIKRTVPYPRAALSAFLASTFGNNIGFAILTGTSIRYRIYTPVGLSAIEIAGVSSMCALTTMLGMGFVFSVAMILKSADVDQTGIPIPHEYLQFTGGLILASIISYLIYSTIAPVTLRTENWSLKLPSAQTTLLQILLATINLSLVASLIFVLLPDESETSYIAFMGVFTLALVAGSASNVPGGIGVFESVLLVGLPEIHPAALLGSILLFRCIYYLTPLAIAAALLVYHETQQQQEKLEKLHDSTLDVLDEIGPQLMALIMLVAGVILLFSGSIPMGYDRSGSMNYVPLIVVELSHLLGAAAGTGLLIAAYGVSRRLKASFNLCTKLLALGILTSLLKGFGTKEAITLGLILAALWYTRPEFRRESSIMDEGFSTDWVSLVSVLLTLTIWLGLFSFKQIPYNGDLWWNFSFSDDYSRFLRSLLVVFGIAGAVTYKSLIRPDPIPDIPEEKVLDKIRQILKYATDPRANLVLLGDKRILFNDSGNAFLMYQIQGRSWVALGNPVGPEEQHPDLIWAFHGICERHGAWPVFYLVDEHYLSLFTELNLNIQPMGDDAIMPLQNFSLSGALRIEVRDVYTRIRQQNINMEIVDGAKLRALMPELKSVSNDWLDYRKTKEMGFSRGFYDPHYIENFPCATLSKDNRVIAFAVIWATPDKNEIGLDLIRHTRDAPINIMDYLIVEMMLTASSQGYRWFNLGTSPISELKDHPLAPLWHRVGLLMYRQSYSTTPISSLRRRKEKFNPQWRPKYLCSPGGVRTPRIMRDITKLISQRNVKARENKPTG